MENAISRVLDEKMYSHYVICGRNGGEMRKKTVCLKKLELALPDGSKQLYYGYGSTVCSVMDSYNKKTGRSIAEKRADKALEWFADAGWDLRTYDYIFGFKHPAHINILTENQLSKLEKNLFAEKPKKEMHEYKIDESKQILVGRS